MKFDSSNYQPLDFIDKLDTKNHLISLYHNSDYGKMIQHHFIKKGLQKEEHCILFTHDNIELIEKEMTDDGINVDYFKQKNLLHIYQIKDVMNHPNGIFKGFDEILKKIISDSKPPYWIAGRVIPNVSTTNGIKAELELERVVHRNFDDLNCSFLCSYNLDKLEEKKRTVWLEHLLKNHHCVIYAVEPKNAVALDSDLLINA